MKEGGQQDSSVKEGGQASKKRRRSNPSEKARLLVATISANRMKAEDHMDMHRTMDFDAIARCQFLDNVDPDSQ